MNDFENDMMEICDNIHEVDGLDLGKHEKLLKTNMLSLINNMFTDSTLESKLVSDIRNRLISMVPELSFEELITLFKTLTSKNYNIYDQFMDLLKNNSNNDVSVLEKLLGLNSQASDDVFDLPREKLNDEQITKLNNLRMLLEKNSKNME
jgi:hypothetical protein